MTYNRGKILKCECSGHALEVEYDIYDKQYWFSMWHLGNNGAILRWSERIRWCWRILTTGHPWADHVILSEERKNELVEYLQTASETADKKEKEILLG